MRDASNCNVIVKESKNCLHFPQIISLEVIDDLSIRACHVHQKCLFAQKESGREIMV